MILTLAYHQIDQKKHCHMYPPQVHFIHAMYTPNYIHQYHVNSQLHSAVPCQLSSTFIHAMQTLRTVIHSGTIPSTLIHTSTLISTYIHSSMVWKQRAHFEGDFQWKLFAWGHDKGHAHLSMKQGSLLGPAPTRTGTMALDPTFCYLQVCME
jgi:hypothetical protein